MNLTLPDHEGDRPAPRNPGRRLLLALVTNLGVVALFAIPAVALWWHAWSGSLSHTLACACGDSGQQVWFIAWPAYALRHGLDPFFTSALWAPKGVNLLSNASFPLVGVVLSPLTWVAGPIVSTNVALVLAPALSAWACWFTCRRMVGWTPAAWIAGAIFGYSPFIVDNAATGHIGLALLVVPPLLLLVGRGLLLGQGSALKWGLALGTLVIVQYFISSEILVITAVVGAVGVVATLVWSPRSIVTSWRFAGLAMLVGTGLAVVVLAWPAWFQLFGPRHLSGSPWPGIQIQGNRVADLVRAGRTGVPNSLLKLGGYEGPAGPPSVYLGYGLVVVGAARRRCFRGAGGPRKSWRACG